jgi:hypothetical protein
LAQVICMHIPALSGVESRETTPAMQAAAVAALGLLYQGTNDRQIAEFLLHEMGKRPSSDR